MSYFPILIGTISASTFCYVALLALLLLGGATRGAGRVFGVYLLGSLVWNLGGLLMLLDIPRAMAWNRLMILGLLAVFFTFFHFTVLFLNRRDKLWVVGLGYVFFSGLVFANMGSLVVRSVSVTPVSFTYEIGPAMPFVLGASQNLTRGAW